MNKKPIDVTDVVNEKTVLLAELDYHQVARNLSEDEVSEKRERVREIQQYLEDLRKG